MGLTVFNIIWMVIVVLVIAVPLAILAQAFRRNPVRFCGDCGSEGTPNFETRGSIFIELVLWLCFLVPGLVYSLWRLTSKRRVCASCGGERLLPPESPMAQKMRAELAQPKAAA
jgi:hypothetical protein